MCRYAWYQGPPRQVLLTYYCDRARHLVCEPYSLANLHRMAAALGLGRHWFHKDHYDIPAHRRTEIMARCVLVPSREIVNIIGR